VKPAEHKFLKFILPTSVFEALKAGTKKFLLECPCGHKRDLWDAGGVKGGGTEQYTYCKCPACDEWKWQKKRKKTDAEKTEIQ